MSKQVYNAAFAAATDFAFNAPERTWEIAVAIVESMNADEDWTVEFVRETMHVVIDMARSYDSMLSEEESDAVVNVAKSIVEAAKLVEDENGFVHPELMFDAVFSI